MSTAPAPSLSPKRRLLRRLKSAALRPEPIYRMYLRLKYGGGGRRALPPKALPGKVLGGLPNAVLQTRAEWERAHDEARRLRLPLHRTPEKDWDHVAAAFAILGQTTPAARVLDAGSEFYSNVLPILFLYGYRDLIGINLDFTDGARRGPIRYAPGDITRSGFADAWFDSVTCLSVIEHGVPLERYLREMHRILKPGGLLITSTDYFATPVETRGQTAHGAAIKIFTRGEIEQFVELARGVGFETTGELDLDCTERPVRWDKFDLEYTFLILTLRKPV